ncbi:MAG: hypothetical protein QOG84_325 [Sphingomonadales bacterium]|jgi:hypothetical protein|nr:hypothetical protein [Sphingomonadales bacterium]
MIVPFLALMLALAQASPATGDYVPDTGWNDDAWSRDFYEGWFGGQLRAMGEPPLGAPADLGPFAERFRLLVLPTFTPAFASRIDVGPDGKAILRWADLNGRGGYEPGTLAREGSRPLRGSELRRFRSALAAAALGSLRRQEGDAIVNDAAGTSTIRLCADGTTFVFEHLDASGRQYVVRQCGIEEKPARRLARLVFDLTGWKAMERGR